ncbi:MAG: cyclic nucleotide-binding domain-containing protein [Campylobacterota bacterium]|nr:cyclic nucleotide-binding domain-containing protein [Campylobacterota bacterium]
MTLQNSIEKLVDGNYKISFDDTIEQLLLEKENLPFFKDLLDDEIKQLLKNVNLIRFFPNEIIFSQGEEKDDVVYYLLDGYVNISKKSPSGFMKKISKIYSKTLLGEVKPLLHGGRTATCIAGSEGAVAISFEIDETNITTQTSQKFYKNICDSLVDKLNQYNIEVDIDEIKNSFQKDSPDYYKDIACKLAKKLQDKNKLL